MSSLDEKVTELKRRFDLGKKSRPTLEANRYHSRIARAKRNGDMQLVKSLSKEASKYPSSKFNDSSFKKLSYVRYADDWIIGVKGSHEETLEILGKVKSHLESMGLTLSEKKTKVTNLNLSSALFLGVLIKRASQHSFTRASHNSILKRNSKKLRFEAPIPRIIEKLKNADFMREGRPSPKFVWLPLEHRQIIHLYNSVFRGFINYYSFAHNHHRVVSRIGMILKQSCAKLLAAKFSLGTMSKVFKKFGPQLSTTIVKDPKKPKTFSFLKPSHKITLIFLTNNTPIVKALYGSVSLASLDDLTCSICESDYRVEMHHIRHMKDLNSDLGPIDKLMIRKNRKQIPLCRECHMDYHHRSKTVNSRISK